MSESHLRIVAVPAQVPIACDFVAAAAVTAGLDDNGVYHCQLAVDEACTNIIEHGYQMRGENQVIDIICQTEIRQFIISILDDGPAFNPLRQSTPDPTTPLEQRSSGGWGIHFIRQFMDDVQYFHHNQRNCLVLVKRLQ
ncbi:MAG TPA: ATP-binding protein [Phototrophicaceae bacterium]|nr:ATP-binding protein [Phototrophicaceae bacterium]